jgi:tRNA pseudouridine55 synthase
MTSPSGQLLVDKATGWTSHDVVACLRRLLGERRIGHAGTLDPLATGLLVVAVGPATRLLRFAQAETKRYVGVVRLGEATDSLDADGELVATAPVPPLSEASVAAAASTLTGPIEQVPPMVSAIKIDGRRLHELAREGRVVERAARAVTISAFSLAPTERAEEWSFDVTCSAGTYVRVLLADFAEALGTLGHLTALRRVASGAHDVADALSLEQVAAAIEAGRDPVGPPSALVASLASVTVPDAHVAAIRHGQRVALEMPATVGQVAAFDADGTLVAVLVRRGELFQPDVVLAG